MNTVPLLLAALGCHGGADDKHPGTGDTDTIDGTTPSTAAADAGRVVLHRLNRTEYDNTVRDLLGTASTPARDFPSDDMVAGWDNIASNLSISPLHVELYELAAQQLAAEVLAVPLPERLTERAEGEGPDVTASTGGSSGPAWNLWSNGSLTTSFDAPVAGTYTLSTRVWADQAGPDLAAMAIEHDGVAARTVDVAATAEGNAELVSVDVTLGAGPHLVSVSFLNDYYDPDLGEDRNLYVDWIETHGPIDVEPGPNPLRDRWVTCDPATDGEGPCAGTVLQALASKAWRRPLAPEETVRLSDLVDTILSDGGSFDDALHWGFVSVLVSPNFVYRVEIDADPTSPDRHALSPYELASRLSYFLWSSMPDEALFAAAERGELSTPDQISAQVRRMLADPKAAALTDNFAGQWLFIRGIDDVFKDPWTFPDFEPALRASMKEEMKRFFASFVASDRDMHELLTATEGEIDALLAEHYDLPFSGSGWQTVDLAPIQRGGLLGQAGLLTITSYPTRTSPVVRGKFVLGQLLCSEPPPPPPGVEGLPPTSDAQTVREQLEQHRADPVCASCHESMDNIGFGLENFDGIGAWRLADQGGPVDASGVLFDTSFDGPRALNDLIATDERFERCMVEKAFTYALGRLPEPSDAPFLDAIALDFASRDYAFGALAEAIATSEPFTTRRGEP